MNKLFKWVLASVGIVIVLVAAGAVILPMLIDPNDYKEEISAAVLAETGRDLSIGGEIKWTVFPSIGFELSDVSLGNRSGFGDQPMFDIGAAGMSIKLIPLFSNKLEVGQVKLSDVSINLQRKADGQNNWEDLTSAGSETTGNSSDSGSGLDSFTVSGIEISNANVTFKDVDGTTELKEFSLNASNIELGKPFDLQGSFSVNIPEEQLNGDVQFGGLIKSEADGSGYGVEGLSFSFSGQQGTGGESVVLDLTISANADIDLKKDQAKLSDFVLQLHDLVVNGELNVTSISANPQARGQLKVAEFSPRSLIKALGMEEPVTNDADAMTRLEAEMSFAGSSSSVSMKDLSVKFDKSVFKGNLKVDKFSHPRLAFDFGIDTLNLDDYLPDPEQASSAGTAGGTDEADLSVETFRGFTGGGDFRIGELVVAGLKATEVSMKMSSNGNGIRFSPVNARFYGGRHVGEIRIDASGSRPLLMVNQKISGVQAKDMLTDLAGSARLEGTGDFSLDINTDLTNSQTILNALSGNIRMSVVDGAIVGIDVMDTLGTVNSLLGKQEEAEGKGGQDQKTEFAELGMSGVFNQGIMTSDDLIMQSPLLKATGKGSFNLVEESIDYLLNPVLSGESGVESLDALSGYAIPIRLTGNLYEPDFKVDIAAAIVGSQKEMISKKASDLLGGLLGGNKDKKKKEEE